MKDLTLRFTIITVILVIFLIIGELLHMRSVRDEPQDLATQ